MNQVRNRKLGPNALIELSHQMLTSIVAVVAPAAPSSTPSSLKTVWRLMRWVAQRGLGVLPNLGGGRGTFAESPIASPSAYTSLRIGIAELSMAVIVAVIDVWKVRMAVLQLAMPVRVLMALGQMQVQSGGHQDAGSPEPGGSGFMEQA